MKYVLHSCAFLLALACTNPPPDVQAASAITAPSVAITDIVLPIDLHEDKYLYVAGEIAGTPTDIVVDSGAGMTVIDSAFAKTLGLEGHGGMNARGVGGEERPIQLASNVTIRLGSLTLAPMTVAILDLEEVHQKLGRRMPVILGKELFHAFPVTIDYPGRRLIVRDPERFEAPAHAVSVPTRSIEQGHVAIEAQLEDLSPAWFMVDTGSGGTVDFHVPYVVANGLLERYPRQAERQSGGVGGMLPQRIAVAGSFTLAGHTFRSVPVQMATQDKGAFAASTSSGTIGAGLLSRFVVTFDLAHDRMLFEPGAALDAAFPKDRLGLSCDVHDGVTRVDFVTPGSPAAAAGLVVGDRIVAVDGVPLEGAALRARLQQVRHKTAGTPVTLTLRGGVDRRVMLADYF